MVTPSKDGCWVFVSLTGGRGGKPGIAVLKRSGGKVDLVRIVPLEAAPTGIRLTHDGKLLVAAATSATVFVDTQKAIAGGSDAVAGQIGGGRGSIYANMTADDKLLFVAEENNATITVIDLDRARRDGYKPEAVIGKIPVGIAPIALTFSPDGKWLYTTSELAAPDWKWPIACKPEGLPVPDSVIRNPEGAVIVIDVARARTDPANAVAARVAAGCSPVRMSISPKGDRIYVTARNNNAVLEFDTSKLVSDSSHAMLGIAPAGTAPVPVMVIDNGKRVIVGNSNRFAGQGAGESLVVLDTAKIRDGLSAVLGTIPAGSFPREMAVSTDGRTLFLTNFGSNSLQVIDIARLPVDPKVPPEIAKNAEAIAHRHDYKPVVVNPKLLARYAGVYKLPDGATSAVFTVIGDQLKAKLASTPGQNAIPISETKFFAMGEEIEFPKTNEGERASQVILRGGQRESVLKRLDDAAAQPYLDAVAAFEKRFKENKPLPGSEAAVKKLLADLQRGKPDEAMFAAGGQQFFQQLQGQFAQMGAVQSISFLGVGPAGPDVYEVKSEKGTWAFRIWLAGDGKVDRAMLTPQQ